VLHATWGQATRSWCGSWWPPDNPDSSNPCSLFLWGYMGDKLYARECYIKGITSRAQLAVRHSLRTLAPYTFALRQWDRMGIALNMLRAEHNVRWTCCALNMLRAEHAARWTCCTLNMLRTEHTGRWACCALNTAFHAVVLWCVCDM
jgi:hypothetical protein